MKKASSIHGSIETVQKLRCDLCGWAYSGSILGASRLVSQHERECPKRGDPGYCWSDAERAELYKEREYGTRR